LKTKEKQLWTKKVNNIIRFTIILYLCTPLRIVVIGSKCWSNEEDKRIF
jgi:hypothetical protein